MPILSEQLFEDIQMEWWDGEIYRYFDDSDDHHLSVMYNANLGTFDNHIVFDEVEYQLSSQQEDNIIQQVNNIKSYQDGEASHRDYVAELWNNR